METYTIGKIIIALTLTLMLSQTASALEITTVLPNANALVSPWEEITLKAVIKGSREVDLPLRAYVVRDGVLLEAPRTKSYLDDDGVATYEFRVLSPYDALSFQFVINSPGAKVSSERFYLERNCSLSQARKMDPKAETAVEKLSLQASHLEEDLAVLETNMSLLRDLEEAIK